jgi:hypothetical protein
MESLWLTLRAELRQRWRPMLGLAVLIAAWPGRAAARVRPAVTLRAE